MIYDVEVGDVLDVLRRKPSGSFDACFTDPPYGLSFMGRSWDESAPSIEVWSEVLRVLRPGAWLLAFGAPRTHHRLMCAIEDAGFEIHDCLSWLYGHGFPKSNSSLKPAWQPIVMAAKRGAAKLLNIESARIPSGEDHRRKCESVIGLDSNRHGACYGGYSAKRESSWSEAGRWPSNVLLAPESANELESRYPGASRFFYCGRATSKERGAGNDHPTVKPIRLETEIARYLLTLTPGRRLLNPYSGSGSELMGARVAGWEYALGIEIDPKYAEISRARMAA